MARLAREIKAAVGYGGVITFDRQQAEFGHLARLLGARHGDDPRNRRRAGLDQRAEFARNVGCAGGNPQQLAAIDPADVAGFKTYVESFKHVNAAELAL